MPVDWSPLANAGITLATAVVSTSGAVLTGLAIHYATEKIAEARSTRLGGAASRAAGVVYDYLQAHPAVGVALETVKQEAWKAGVAYMTQGKTGALIAKMGLPPDRVADMVRGEMGKLKALDPTVTVPALTQDGGR